MSPGADRHEGDGDARGDTVRVVITGGGTGGHLFPGLAVCRALGARRPEAQVLFIGAARGLEATVVPRLGLAFRGLQATGLQGASWRGRLAALGRLPAALGEARRLLREFRAQLVLGVGGYASVATVLAAAWLRIPRVIHEQNAFPGLANRWLGRLASAVALSFPETATFFPRGRVTVTGNPIRPEIRPGDPAAARRRLALDPARFTVLVSGGSQGAHRVNLGLMEALPLLAASRDRLQFVHATGARDLEAVRQAYAQAGAAARAEAFFEDMATAYQAADFAVCRAGAGTVFELAALGLPALLVPYPHAANDHQRLNAEAAVAAGGAWTLPDGFCDGRRLAAAVETALTRPAQRLEMGRRAKSLARPEAADRIVDLLERVALPAA
jgi:UDP-N-acetylglucosamine--N-acetylmuramyl-(pentapeptide) pyrophosphoryl-undecaprenol N-acetylglucosamine transferase